MRLALISDIHANRHALEAVAAELDRLGCDRLISLGDAVGYGAFPHECLDWLRGRADVLIRGNHDHLVATGRVDPGWQPHARQGVLWTAEQLSGPERDWLLSWPLTARQESLFCCHAHPREPLEWAYVLDAGDAADVFRIVPAGHVAVGHSHRPGCFLEAGGALALPPGKPVPLGGRRVLLNPGSVGQPRDGDPRAAFMLLDTGEWTITLYRVAYDLEGAGQAIRAAGLPVFLAERLREGR